MRPPNSRLSPSSPHPSSLLPFLSFPLSSLAAVAAAVAPRPRDCRARSPRRGRHELLVVSSQAPRASSLFRRPGPWAPARLARVRAEQVPANPPERSRCPTAAASAAASSTRGIPQHQRRLFSLGPQVPTHPGACVRISPSPQPLPSLFWAFVCTLCIDTSYSPA